MSGGVCTRNTCRNIKSLCVSCGPLIEKPVIKLKCKCKRECLLSTGKCCMCADKRLEMTRYIDGVGDVIDDKNYCIMCSSMIEKEKVEKEMAIEEHRKYCIMCSSMADSCMKRVDKMVDCKICKKTIYLHIKEERDIMNCDIEFINSVYSDLRLADETD